MVVESGLEKKHVSLNSFACLQNGRIGLRPFCAAAAICLNKTFSQVSTSRTLILIQPAGSDSLKEYILSIGGKGVVQLLAYLLPDHAAPGSIPSVSKKNFIGYRYTCHCCSG